MKGIKYFNSLLHSKLLAPVPVASMVTQDIKIKPQITTKLGD